MTNRRESGGSRRLTATDWIEAAYRAIAEGGVAAVAVEPLAQQLGVTKGSFYWHFPNREALLQAALERWEQEETEAAIAALDEIADPRERLQQLILRALTDDRAAGDTATPAIAFGHAFHLAVSDAADDPIVQPILRRVSERRVDYLIDCFRAAGLASDEARFRALLAYAAYVGTLRLLREAPDRMPADESAIALRQHFLTTLMPDEGDGVLG
ncbi:MAG: TetR/AcrR family transcriptional regulator [Thermomicrobiales bacterium]